MKKIWFVLVAMLMAGSFSLGIGKEFDKEIEVEPGKKLSVNIKTGGSIEIHGWEKHIARITVEGKIYDSDVIDLQKDEDGIRVEIDNGSGYDGGSIEFVADVPNKFDLDLQTMGGSIEISSVEGTINGQTMGGSLRLDNLKGEIKMTTMGGEISLQNAELNGTLKTMGGAVNFFNVVGNIEGITMGGSVTHKNVRRKAGETPGSGGEVKISTMGGEIYVDDAPMGADVHTMGGEITVKNANIFVKAKTMGGEITIENADGWIDATTMGGDVTAVMTGDPSKGKRDVYISSKGGDIDLTLPKGISADFDIRLTYTKNSNRNYDIKSDFDINVEEPDKWDYGKGSPRKIIYGKGEINGGKNRIKVETVNGDIRIRKSD
jgi:hypothetical protein